ncbi:hypothetical protein BTR14_08160 [Rhizobium rhizosphaerae]|uniref:N-acetyltransferase domain-containing protein n=1 Tax=Xaviernesmea rhizosphaerae TaxID=1672749 RepID=A0ABX3PFM1_9HYPH|nr:GNAT family N-acetyltransferase [Xaviernesmea rhizosphaerae]OQP86902.1 hypothetical protein BTR14_08160 [Xaviernesmea rhizosphaerae]
MKDHQTDFRMRAALPQDRALLRALLDAHLDELSGFAPVDRAYPWFDLYFSEPDRWAWLAEVDSAVAGFALVNRHAASGLPAERVMAEFFVTRGFRRQGRGRRFAGSVFAAAPGQWELSVLSANAPGLAFWLSVCGAYPAFQRIDAGEETILRFVVASPSSAI